MRIYKTIYVEILNTLPNVPPETGGIIGSKASNIVCTFHFDKGLLCDDKGTYWPDVMSLSDIINSWQQNGIRFSGIIHSHVSGIEELSIEDREYIQSIMNAMPEYISKLYFPVVIPHIKMVPFVAVRQKNGVTIERETITFAREGGIGKCR